MFMELFIDAYDWVMVPNVHVTSQLADGGGMTTKPYISGSSYVLKMSDFKPAGETDTTPELPRRWITPKNSRALLSWKTIRRRG
jgi:deoxyribodipyrimidine photolyase-related protein